MRWILTAVAVAMLAPGAEGCGNDCKLDARSGMRITVTADTGAPICDAIVSIVYEDSVEQPEPSLGDDCPYFGAYERAGTLDVRVVHGGVEQRQQVKVSKGACHVKTEQVAFTFPAP